MVRHCDEAVVKPEIAQLAALNSKYGNRGLTPRLLRNFNLCAFNQ